MHVEDQDRRFILVAPRVAELLSSAGRSRGQIRSDRIFGVFWPHSDMRCLASPRLVPSRLASPRLASPRLASPRLTSPHLASPRLASPRLASPHLISPHLASPHLTSPRLTLPHFTSSHLTSPRLTLPLLTSPHLTSPHPTSPCLAAPCLAPPRPASPRGGSLSSPCIRPDGRPAIQIPPPAHQDLWIYVHFDKATIKRWQAPPLRHPQRVMCHVSRPASGCISPSIIEHPLRVGLILASERGNYWEALSVHIACSPMPTMDRESAPVRRFFRSIPRCLFHIIS